MIRNYFRVLHITIEKIIIGNTQTAHDVPETSPEGSLNALTSKDLQETFRGLWGDQYKNWWFYEKTVFQKYLIVLVLHICLCFLEKEQIFKSSKRERPRDDYWTQLRDVHETKWWNVLRTSVGRLSNIFLKLNSQIH